MPTSPFPIIPTFYHFFFTTLDPLICLWGASMDFFTPTTVLSSHIPQPTSDSGHLMILKQRGGNLLALGIISALLLRRYPADLTIWRIVQTAELVVDGTYFWAVTEVLKGQGRLGVETWRKEDWGSVGITGAATLARVAFLLGMGFANEGKKKPI